MRTWKETHVEACTPGEYPELLRLLDASYGMENGWFLRHEGHLYPDPYENDFERISRNKLLKENGKILGGLGLFPLTFQAVLGGHVIHLSVAGIGSVFTVKEYRNQGVMSHMLDFAVQHVKENGYDLSWLSGNRHRYRNYGWDLAGRQGRYLVEEKAVRKYYPQDIQTDISVPDETCKEFIAGKYAGHQCGAVRDARHWSLQLKRDNLVWKTARTATGFAYMVHDTERPAEISEIQGDGPETVALLKRHMSDSGLGAIEVFSPWCGFANPVPLLNHISSRCTMESIGQLRIVNGKQLREKLMPAMKSSILFDSPRFPTDKLEDPDLWIQTLKGMLGFVCVDKSLPEDLDTLQRAMPIHWWLSRIDSV